MAKIGARLFFDLPGLGRINSMPGATFNPGGVSREGVVADTGPAGHTESDVQPTMSCKIPNTANADMNALRNIDGIPVTVQDDNGKTWLVEDCYCTTPPTLTSGEIDLELSGTRAVPVS